MEASLPVPELVEDEDEPEEPAQPGAVVSDWQFPAPLVPVPFAPVPVPELEDSVPLPFMVPPELDPVPELVPLPES